MFQSLSLIRQYAIRVWNSWGIIISQFQVTVRSKLSKTELSLSLAIQFQTIYSRFLVT